MVTIFYRALNTTISTAEIGKKSRTCLVEDRALVPLLVFNLVCPDNGRKVALVVAATIREIMKRLGSVLGYQNTRAMIYVETSRNLSQQWKLWTAVPLRGDFNVLSYRYRWLGFPVEAACCKSLM